MQIPFKPLVALLLAFSSTQAWAQAKDPEQLKDWVLQSGSLSTLRLLDEDAHLYEHPTGGMITRLGSQARSVDLSDGTDSYLTRTNFALALGFKYTKLLLMFDALRLSPDVFPHSKSTELANRVDVLMGLPITFNKDFALIPALRYKELNRDDKSLDPGDSLRFMLRAKLAGVRLTALQETKGVSIRSSFSPFEFLTLMSGQLGETLLATLGQPELLYERYEQGSSPYSLEPLSAPGEDNVGLRWELANLLPRNTVHASALARVGGAGLAMRRVEVGASHVFKLLDFRLFGAMASNNCGMLMCNPCASISPILGIGAPGATLLWLNATAFGLNMDEGLRPGFSASARLSLVSNNNRLTQSRKRDMSDYVLMYEGDETERVNFFVEARLAMNDFHSLKGLPLADELTFGIWVGSEALDFDPVSAGIARSQRDALNEVLDNNDDYMRDRERERRFEGLRKELRYPVPDVARLPASAQLGRRR